MFCTRAVFITVCIEILYANYYEPRKAGDDIMDDIYNIAHSLMTASTADQKHKSNDINRLRSFVMGEAKTIPTNANLLADHVQTASVTDDKRSMEADVELTDINIRVLKKRWSRMMFACHCTGFHVGCHSNSYCSRRYGHDFKCRRHCCGTSCKLH
ncbi:uncharacterized protein LOC121370939 [Gigantopelta aegis]|uniref:uncharacterized protein LOC121370939 n=1 Tax=Gigantopelta aegis TaxID=1735272 RepID=UPI001B889EA0|nr:uncharacterized protein LOC121370939 [Gigantopelta aegis]